MNVLLTGGTGYIGSHTAVVLSELGHQVILFDNLTNSSDSVLEKLALITGQQMPFIKGDVRDTGLLVKTLNTHGISAVLHFSGLKAIGESVENPIEYYSNNIHGTISLLQAMQTARVKMLVFSSSATVYGEPRYLPIDENHPTNANNPYGRSKLHIEEILSDLPKADPEWRIACLRYFNPVGAHMSGLIGESYNGRPTNLMPAIAQVAAGQKKEISVFGDDYPTADGTGVRDYIHVMDLAEGHLAALGLLSKIKGCHAINLGTGRGYSVLEMINEFELISGRQIPYKIVSRRAGDVAECFANSNKANEILNWRATRNLSVMCESAWRFQQYKLGHLSFEK
jgi:UDP-glucose 4-epimerase